MNEEATGTHTCINITLRVCMYVCVYVCVCMCVCVSVCVCVCARMQACAHLSALSEVPLSLSNNNPQKLNNPIVPTARGGVWSLNPDPKKNSNHNPNSLAGCAFDPAEFCIEVTTSEHSPT